MAMLDSHLDAPLKPLLDRLSRHVNAHRFLWLLALTSFLLAWNRGLDLLYGMVALVLAVLAVSWLLPWLAVRGVTVERVQQGSAQAGKPLQIQYRVRTRRPCYHLILRDTLPCAIDGGQPDVSLPSVTGEAIFTATRLCGLRGVFVSERIGVGSGWPFGFVERIHWRQTSPLRLVVMPRSFAIACLPALRSDIPAIDGYSQTAHPDINNQFAGVREYRFGDSLKHIHWGASARHQTLIVREYESHDRPHLLMVIDGRAGADIGDAPWSSFEYAVTIAASLIEYAMDQQIGMHLIVGGRQPLEVTVPPGARNSHDYLEPLARVKADGTDSYAALVASALERFGNINALVTVRNQSEVAQLPPVNTGHLDILLQDDSFLYPLRRYPEGWQGGSADHQVLLVSRNSDLEALFRHDHQL
jgi:uncharacterized protein (DUF58 family)